jgi:sugar transferase (PEP-CTERM/EpsH1 system associated)
LGTHWQLWKLLRRLKPAILHTYNLTAIEYAFTATLAGVPIRVHAEHGRDLGDPEGKNAKHNLLRRLLIPFIDRYVAVSRDLQCWLQDVVGIPVSKHCLIHNGVDMRQFHPDAIPMPTWTTEAGGFFVVGTVGRIQDIKNHAGLVRAFMKLQIMLPEHRDLLRLVIIGGGPLMSALKEQVAAAGLTEQVWLPGARSDVAMLMRRLSIFVLPSFAEGTPVTLLEAMASGLPVVASNVGGIPEVVKDGESGFLVTPTDENAIASLLVKYFRQPSLAVVHGAVGRTLIEKNYSIDAMLDAYLNLYDTLCDKKLSNNS